MIFKEYSISIDSSVDIYNGNLTSFICLLPTRYKNIEAAQLIDITVPGISNVFYEYIAIEDFNQISGPTGGVNFAFAKISLDGTNNPYISVPPLTYNYDYIRLGNPIAALDRLQVSFVDAHGNLVSQPSACNFQLRILQQEDESLWGQANINDTVGQRRRTFGRRE